MSAKPQSICIEKIVSGDRSELARAITLVESSRSNHRELAEDLLQSCLGYSGNALRIGLSGPPGVGKSTLIEILGCYAISLGKKIAILAVDPSSQTHGGSILGDKTRMVELSAHQQSFIRPSPAGKIVGGVARRTQETIMLCEAAGFDLIIVETVGVGQSETVVADLTDLFVLMLMPGSGDELQGIKKGIMELADIVLVNKADGELKTKANLSVADIKQALCLVPPRRDFWQTEVMAISALQIDDVKKCWDLLNSFNNKKIETGMFEKDRTEQLEKSVWSEAQSLLIDRLMNDGQVKKDYDQLFEQVTQQKMLPSVAATRLIKRLIK